MSNAVVSAFKNKQLRKKLLFTTLILIVVRFGSQLPIPEIDSAQISAYLKSTLGDSFSLLNSFTGGSFMQMSVFALSVTPYITSSIIMQLMTIVIPALEEMQKDGEDGRKRMAKITRYVTVVLAIIEGAGLAIGFANQGALGTDYTTFTIVTMIIALTAGAVLVMWLGERITESGIGNGISIILLINIVARIPNDLSNLYQNYVAKPTDVTSKIIAAVIILAIISMYNGLVQSKIKVDNAWSQIDVQLQRRFDLIPNFVETVKGYMTHEQETFEKIAQLRTSWANAESVSDKAKLDGELSTTLKTIMAVSENYPDLKANQNFSELSEELRNTENKISFSRQFYNDTVTMYNQKLQIFPSNIIANMFNFTPRELFTVDNAEARKNVKVDFGKKD